MTEKQLKLAGFEADAEATKKSGKRKPTKVGALIVKVTTLVIVVHWPLLITALRVTAGYVPAAVGVPEITPADVSTVRPGGNPVAL